jgi:hypothetical protein
VSAMAIRRLSPSVCRVAAKPLYRDLGWARYPASAGFDTPSVSLRALNRRLRMALNQRPDSRR